MSDLKGKVAVVTGASKGIGAATTVMAGVMFANIVVHDEAHRGFRAIHK